MKKSGKIKSEIHACIIRYAEKVFNAAAAAAAAVLTASTAALRRSERSGEVDALPR